MPVSRMTKSKGLALVVAIAILAISVVLEIAFIMLFYNNYRLSEKLLNEIKAYYYAYGGYVYGLNQARLGITLSGPINLPATDIFVNLRVSLTNTYFDGTNWIESYEIVSYAETASGEKRERPGKAKTKAWVERIVGNNKIRLYFWREVEPKEI